jgi:hypothetical protein
MAFLEAKNSIIFAKIFVIFLRLRKIENSEFSKHYKKMTLKSNFEKLVATQIPTRTFKFKFKMQGLNLFIEILCIKMSRVNKALINSDHYVVKVFIVEAMCCGQDMGRGN